MTKHNDEKRDCRLTIPVTQNELERIKFAASNTVYGSTANFCREILFQCVDLIEAEFREDNEYTVEIRKSL